VLGEPVGLLGLLDLLSRLHCVPFELLLQLHQLVFEAVVGVDDAPLAAHKLGGLH
jgi:hypothetical protein